MRRIQINTGCASLLVTVQIPTEYRRKNIGISSYSNLSQSEQTKEVKLYETHLQ